jgi:hypothetical protein
MMIANLFMAVAWSQRRLCRRCSERLVAAARRIAPEAGRYLILRSKGPRGSED